MAEAAGSDSIFAVNPHLYPLVDLDFGCSSVGFVAAPSRQQQAQLAHQSGLDDDSVEVTW